MTTDGALNTADAPSNASPLWIIALFIALSEVTAGVAAVTTDGTLALIFAAFAVVFPLLVLGIFVWVLLKHPGNLYSPGQYTAQTDVQLYVETLNRENQDRDAVLKQAVSEALASGTLAGQKEPHIADQALRVQVAAKFEEVITSGNVTVDRSRLIEGAKPIQIATTPDTTVSELLDSIWFTISSAVDSFTYNKSWVLADQDLTPFDDIGTQYEWQRDERRLEEAGIAPGSTLIVLPGGRSSRSPSLGGDDSALRSRLEDLVVRVQQAAESDGCRAERRISGERGARLMVNDGETNFALYAMPGPHAMVFWVTQAGDASSALALEQNEDVTPVLVLERMPSQAVRSECKRLSVLVMWSDDRGVHDAPWRRQAGEIPTRVDLLDLLGLQPPTAEELERRWSGWRGDLSATVGMGADGPVSLDLRSEGPHVLIAGTTGSGKSEFLRTLVAAMAATVPPHRLTFLLVDYKGGAAFAPCAALPHVLDIVTDLDERLAERALISLNAELKRRERILAREGAKDLLELTQRNAGVAPPVLVIAVDEFAKLREEFPQFVDGLVDVAQRGRSLGVHMVLAAQTLRNAFTPAIRANTNLRVALRVSAESESEDMIASPAAARIVIGRNSHGRAFARTGHGELREFQAAYISGRTDVSEQRKPQPSDCARDVASKLDLHSNGGSDPYADSDLVALGRAASEACARLDQPVPRPPWLPVLPAVLGSDGIEKVQVSRGRVAIGLVDVPQLQRQDPLVLDLNRAGHVSVFGARNSGKTMVLTTTALALAHSAAPGELAIYCLDAASGDLTPLADLPQCGGVVMVDDEEQVQRLLRLLARRVAQHQQRAGKDDHGKANSGMTVLLLDDVGSFVQQYDRPSMNSPYDQLQKVIAGGRAAGVHVVLTASHHGALPAAWATHFGQRLVLRMPTEEDVIALGLDPKTIRGARLPAGRGFTQDGLEFQVATTSSGGGVVPLERP